MPLLLLNLPEKISKPCKVMFEFSVVVSRFRTGDVYFVNITVKIFFVLVFRYLYQQRFDLEVES